MNFAWEALSLLIGDIFPCSHVKDVLNMTYLQQFLDCQLKYMEQYIFSEITCNLLLDTIGLHH